MDSQTGAGESDAGGIEYEDCVVCGDKTNVKVDTHIDFRHGYIEGSGQLCSRCHYTKKTYLVDGYMEFS